MKYPLKNHKTGGFYPASGKCGYCDESTNGRFVVISFSAMTEFAPGRLAPAEVQTSFGLFDHGVTKSGAPLNIFENTKDAFLCSTACLRSFLNQLVTDFENLEA